jgi:hypothetical protein
MMTRSPAFRLATALALAMLPQPGLTKEDGTHMTRPTLTLAAPDSILVGEAFQTTITAGNPTDAPVSTVSARGPRTIVHRLEPDAPLPDRQLIITQLEQEAVVENDDVADGPPGSDDDEEDATQDDGPEAISEDAPFYFVLSSRQKREALAPDDRFQMSPVQMADLAPGDQIDYSTWPSDFMVEPIPAGNYRLTGIMIGSHEALDTPPRPFQIRPLAASALAACTHVGGGTELVVYAHRESDGIHVIYHHATGPGARGGPGYPLGRAGSVDSLAQTCGGDPMRLGPFWVAWIEAGSLRATIAEQYLVYGTVETLLNLPGATLAPQGWQDGNDARFLALGEDGQAALVSVSLDGDRVPQVARLSLELPGLVQRWQAGRTEDGGFVVVAAVRSGDLTRVLAISVDPAFGNVRDTRLLLTTPYPLADLSIDQDGDAAHRAHVLLGPVHDLSEQDQSTLIIEEMSLFGSDGRTKVLLAADKDIDRVTLKSRKGSGALVRVGTHLIGLHEGAPTVLTENLAEASVFLPVVIDGRAFALVADPDWGLVYLPAERLSP